MLNIAVLVSGGGTNLQALIDDGINISAVISSKQGAYALERAKKAGIATYVIARKDYNDREAYSDALLSLLKELKADLIVLAGFMCVLSGEILREYKNRIINVHPSLIPSFCGDGYYGLRVHEAALNKGVKITGATVHFVSAVTDGGPIILQKAVEVYEGDTPVTLQKRVMEQAEWEILPRAVRLFCGGRLTVENGIVHIKEE
ncbi:MAG: phosphoribosylglycinamide formyltransferase [Oscillospiraceae bacterium]|jgi:phosphoribosylglycinamide formyltransferase-1